MTTTIQIRRIVDDQRVFVDMPDGADNPCTACGACCATYRVSFYCGEVSGGSGGFVPADFTAKVNDVLACMKGTEYGGGRCIALEGELGRAGIGCRIYPDRPSTCREFSPWQADGAPDPECRRARARIGLPPLAPLPQERSVTVESDAQPG